jgi:hypothetical protein
MVIPLSLPTTPLKTPPEPQPLTQRG